MNWMAVLAGLSAALNVYLFFGLLFLRKVIPQRIDHAKCIAHIADITSNRFAARLVHDLADRYENIDGQAELTRIRNTVYGADTESVPALWMREQAERIERGA